MGRRAKNKQAPPQEFATAAAAAPTQAKRKADGYVPRSGGKKLKLGPDGKKIRKAPAPKPAGLVAPGAAKAAKGKGKAKDEDELLCVRWRSPSRREREQDDLLLVVSSGRLRCRSTCSRALRVCSSGTLLILITPSACFARQ